MDASDRGIRKPHPAEAHQGQQIQLSNQNQQALASWSVVTVLLLQHTHSRAAQLVIPASDYAGVYETKSRTALMKVFTGYLEPPGRGSRVEASAEYLAEDRSMADISRLPFQLNPHYLDTDPSSCHQGETRQQRIEEFLEENDVPVLGLREGAWLHVSGQRAVLAGRNTGGLFRRHTAPSDVPIGADLSYLLGTQPRFDIGTGT